jgi:hypothetical protein
MKYYKTTIKIEVLSEDKPVDDLDLYSIEYAITEGDCSGDIEFTEVKELTPKECAEELEKQGSDSSFFMLTRDGKPL